ncbi:MAG: hypothetical protein J6X88_01875 [Bacteroidales bacterium]|nr:hypothetical protein [Bacteroidales bacterium]
MQNYLQMDGLYINEEDRYSQEFVTDFHRLNSMAAQREVQRMSLHPYSLEQKLAQIEELHLMATTSKERSNAERSRLNV